MTKSCRITYIGSFPPPYGGVTVKNALLYKHLSSRLEIEKIDLTRVKRFAPGAIFRLAHRILSRKGALVLGVSAGWRYKLTSILYHLNRKKMHRSLLVVMGGKTPESKAYANRMSCYRRVYVETEGMKSSFETTGVRNATIYPNCRERHSTSISIRNSGDRMSCVFFSLVSPGKGARIVLDAAQKLPEIDFHFYGRIEHDYEFEFSSTVAATPNVSYHGVFDSVADDAISELNKYDIHLFPTLCPNEGVPGVIVETKMAGVPTIASDRGYNAELVTDGVDGILTHTDTAAELAGLLRSLAANPARINLMKAEALASSEYFYIDKYIDLLTADLAEAVEKVHP